MGTDAGNEILHNAGTDGGSVCPITAWTQWTITPLNNNASERLDAGPRRNCIGHSDAAPALPPPKRRQRVLMYWGVAQRPEQRELTYAYS